MKRDGHRGLRLQRLDPSGTTAKVKATHDGAVVISGSGSSGDGSGGDGTQAQLLPKMLEAIFFQLASGKCSASPPPGEPVVKSRHALREFVRRFDSGISP